MSKTKQQLITIKPKTKNTVFELISAKNKIKQNNNNNNLYKQNKIIMKTNFKYKIKI